MTDYKHFTTCKRRTCDDHHIRRFRHFNRSKRRRWGHATVLASVAWSDLSNEHTTIVVYVISVAWTDLLKWRRRRHANVVTSIVSVAWSDLSDEHATIVGSVVSVAWTDLRDGDDNIRQSSLLSFPSLDLTWAMNMQRSSYPSFPSLEQIYAIESTVVPTHHCENCVYLGVMVTDDSNMPLCVM